MFERIYATGYPARRHTAVVANAIQMEFHVSGSDYGMLAEGDTGRLTFQGTRYLSFER